MAAELLKNHYYFHMEIRVWDLVPGGVKIRELTTKNFVNISMHAYNSNPNNGIQVCECVCVGYNVINGCVV